jgi:hypothetical protein
MRAEVVDAGTAIEWLREPARVRGA